MTKLYVVSLEGQGDHDIRLVTKEVFDWINSPAEFPQGQTGMVDPNIPQSVLDDLEDGEEVTIYINSYENDRALWCHETSVFYSSDLKSLFDYVRDNDIEVMGSYEGYIY